MYLDNLPAVQIVWNFNFVEEKIILCFLARVLFSFDFKASSSFEFGAL